MERGGIRKRGGKERRQEEGRGRYHHAVLYEKNQTGRAKDFLLLAVVKLPEYSISL